MPIARKAWITYPFIILLSVVAAVVLAEWRLASQAGERLTIPFYNHLYPYVMFRPIENDRFISHDVRLTSNVMSHHTQVVQLYTNEDGFRVPALDYSLPKQKPAGQLRIAVLGSSAVQLGTTYELALPGALRAVLREKYPGRDIEVINAGIQSCVSRQSLCHLLFSVLDYSPDIVIFYDGFNDLMLPLNYESRSNFPYNFQTMEAAWQEYRSERQDPLWQLVLDRSHLYRALRARFSGGEHQKPPGLFVGANAKSPQEILDNPQSVAGHVAAYLSNWRILIELSAAYDYKPVCILQPTAVLDPVYGPKVTAEGYQLDEKTAANWTKALAALYEEASRQVRQMQSQHPERTIRDFSRTLIPGEKHFWDVVHVYDETNRLLAEKLYTEIERDVEPVRTKSPE